MTAYVHPGLRRPGAADPGRRPPAAPASRGDAAACRSRASGRRRRSRPRRRDRRRRRQRRAGLQPAEGEEQGQDPGRRAGRPRPGAAGRATTAAPRRGANHHQARGTETAEPQRGAEADQEVEAVSRVTPAAAAANRRDGGGGDGARERGDGRATHGAPLRRRGERAPTGATTERAGEEVSGVVIGSPGRRAKAQLAFGAPGPAQRRRRRRRRSRARRSRSGRGSASRGARLGLGWERRRGSARVIAAAIDLGDGLSHIATALRVPVLIAAVVVLILCALELGRFAAEWWRRLRNRRFDLARAGRPGDRRTGRTPPTTRATRAARSPPAPSSAIAAAPAAERGTATERALVDYELAVQRRLDRTRLLVRAGPAIGLMGTLIPLIPGLAALAGGDVVTLAERPARRLRRHRRRPPGRHRRLRPDPGAHPHLHRRPGGPRAGTSEPPVQQARARRPPVSRIGLGRHRAIEADAGDPLDGLVNLFDVGMILAIAFLIAGLGLTLNLKSDKFEAAPRRVPNHRQDRRRGKERVIPDPAARPPRRRPRHPGRPGLPPPRRPPRLRQGATAAASPSRRCVRSAPRAPLRRRRRRGPG